MNTAADLSDNDWIESAAKQLNELDRIDLFYKNAGVLLGKRQGSKDGVEMSAQVHTIAPYLFGRLLSPSLAGATVLTGLPRGSGTPSPSTYPNLATHPLSRGSVKTPMTASDEMPKWLRPVRTLFFSSPDKAAHRLKDAATRPDIKELSGALILQGKVKELPKNAGDPLVQADLIAWCKEVTGI